MSLSDLRRLANIITESVDIIERLAEESGLKYPAITDLYDPEAASEKFTIEPKVLETSVLAASAACQLAATLKLPGMSLLDRANAFHIPSALRIASEAGVVELLREAGPKGLSAKSIAERTHTKPGIMERALRLLATHYVFTETEPGVFANNRISSMMDTGEAPKGDGPNDITPLVPSLGHGISNVQGAKYTERSSISALVEQCTDEVFKSSAFLPEVVLANGDSNTTPFQTAMQTTKPLWEFLREHPGYLQRIQMAMVAWTKLQPQKMNGFEWSDLPEGSLVVDIGGGNGSQSFQIANEAPHINIVIQDRNDTIKAVTQPEWENDPTKRQMLNSGRVKLEGHDFFERQPHRNDDVAVFFLRFITHDWDTPKNVEILKLLNAAASATTRLVIVDQLVPYACLNPQLFDGVSAPPPEPLLGNLGEANSDVYITDFTMAVLLNSQERTLGEFKEITEAAGWGVEKIYQTAGSSLAHIVCGKRS